MKYYIAAVSGGPDSMAMLNKYKKRIKAVCHVNYNKRKDSNIDEEIVRSFCSQNKIDFFLRNVNDNEYNTKENFQSLARYIRYDFFEQVSKEININYLLVAHNQDDFIETAYMQKNKRSKSLFYGIKKQNKYKTLNVYRPLLFKSKKSLMQYCQKHKIRYAIDSSNEQDIYERNKVRKIVKSWSISKRIFFIIEIKFYNIKNFFLRLKIDKKYKKWNSDIDFLLKQNDKIKYYLLYLFLQDNNIVNNSNKKIQNIINFVKNKSEKKFLLKENKYLLIRKHKLKIEEK